MRTMHDATEFVTRLEATARPWQFRMAVLDESPEQYAEALADHIAGKLAHEGYATATHFVDGYPTKLAPAALLAVTLAIGSSAYGGSSLVPGQMDRQATAESPGSWSTTLWRVLSYFRLK